MDKLSPENSQLQSEQSDTEKKLLSEVNVLTSQIKASEEQNNELLVMHSFIFRYNFNGVFSFGGMISSQGINPTGKQEFVLQNAKCGALSQPFG